MVSQHPREMDCRAFHIQFPPHPNLPNQTTDWTLAHAFMIHTEPHHPSSGHHPHSGNLVPNTSNLKPC